MTPSRPAFGAIIGGLSPPRIRVDPPRTKSADYSPLLLVLVAVFSRLLRLIFHLVD